MSEFRLEKYPENTPLNQLNNELRRPGRTYGDLVIALDTYIQAELNLDDKGTYKVIYDMRENGVLPVSDLFEYDKDLAVEQFRLVLWRYVIPLAEGLMHDEELDEWLPRAMNVVLPRDSRHLPDRCHATPGANDWCCAIGNCPVMVVESTLQKNMMTPDFSELDYTINPVKAIRNHHRRLAVATRRGIVPPMFSATMGLHYQALCDEAFQGDS